MSVVGDITARFVALAGDMSGVTLAGDVYPATLVNRVPFCFVEEGAATFEKISPDIVAVTQTWTLLLYVQEFETEITGQEDAAYQAVRPFLTTVPLHFGNCFHLERNDTGVRYVKRARLTRHEGIQSADRENRLYMGVAFTFSVEYDLYVNEA